LIEIKSIKIINCDFFVILFAIVSHTFDERIHPDHFWNETVETRTPKTSLSYTCMNSNPRKQKTETSCLHILHHCW